MSAAVEATTLRMSLVMDGEQTRAIITHGQLFQSHGGVWSDEPAPAPREEVLQASGPRKLVGGAGQNVVIELEDQKPFFMGELRLDQSAQDIVCWNHEQVFGSPWSNQPLELAHYDPGLQECVTAEGKPAPLNDVPLAVVLEAQNGDCADLRGLSLHGSDFGSPDLFLSLRGADLTDARLNFANLSGSFEGARMAGLSYGYAEVSGTVDEATELPTSGICEVIESPRAGDSLTCRN